MENLCPNCGVTMHIYGGKLLCNKCQLPLYKRLYPDIPTSRSMFDTWRRSSGYPDTVWERLTDEEKDNLMSEFATRLTLARVI